MRPSSIEIHKHLSAPPARVFAAFADPTLVPRWLTPSPEVSLTVLQFDFRVGGTYRFAYDVPGVGRMIVGGSYRAIEPPSRLVFSWVIEPPDEHAGIASEVTATLIARDSGTDLSIRHIHLGRPDAEARHAAGWQGALEQLAALVADSEVPRGDR